MDMPMDDRVPGWVTPLAWVWIALCVASAAYLLLATARDRRPSPAGWTGRVVWVASALYLGPVAVWLHARHAAAGSRAASPAGAPRSTLVAGLPGGGASALAHLVGVPLVVASGLTIAGTDLWVMILVIGVLAVLLLALHELASDSSGRTTPATAAATALLTVLAFDVGMGGWMLVLHYNALMPPATDAAFWLLMQVGVVLGLVTGSPVVRLVERRRDAAASARDGAEVASPQRA